MHRTTKILATGVTVLALLVGAPGAALAEVDNIWSKWYVNVTDRQEAEIPFAILFSLPAMIFSTPFWLGIVAVDKLTEDDE